MAFYQEKLKLNKVLQRLLAYKFFLPGNTSKLKKCSLVSVAAEGWWCPTLLRMKAGWTFSIDLLREHIFRPLGPHQFFGESYAA